MSTMGLYSIAVKKFRPHSSKPNVGGNKNILNRDFKASAINQKWCADITHIYTIKNGWTYLATVMDLYSRKIIGYAYEDSMTVDLVIKSLENACLNVKSTKGIILHTDLGTQYTSQKFQELISKKGIIHSFSRKGNPYDNACIESFHSILKKEEVNHNKYYDFKTASRAIFEFIESWYNRKRIHSSINYMTPNAVYNEAK